MEQLRLNPYWVGAVLIRHYLGREPPENLEEFDMALAEVEFLREKKAKDLARGIAIAFGD